MKLTKEDLMRLPKERLAELLVEAMNEPKIEYIPVPQPSPTPSPWPFNPITYAAGAITDKE